MSEYLVLLKRELKSIAKEKTIVFAMMVQFFIAAFSSVVLVGLMAFYDPTSISETATMTVRVGVVGDRNGVMQGYLKERGIKVWSFTELARAEEAFRVGQIDTIISIPESQSGIVDMKLILPRLETRSTVILLLMNEPLKKYENYLREANGIRLQYKEPAGKPHTTYEFLYSVIVPILMLFPALVAGGVVIDTVSEEFENKTFDTLISAPVSVNQVFAAKISAAVFAAVVQVIIWGGLLGLNRIIIHRPALVFLIAVISAAALSFVAAFIALYFKDRERAQFFYSILLIVMIAISYFLNSTSFNLITRLAAGTPAVNGLEVAIQAMPLILMGVAFFKLSKRLI